MDYLIKSIIHNADVSINSFYNIGIIAACVFIGVKYIYMYEGAGSQVQVGFQDVLKMNFSRYNRSFYRISSSKGNSEEV